MDRVKKNQELKELIKEKAYVENPQNKPITDGPIDPNRFFTTSKLRTVFISQEPYGDNGGWDMSESLNAKSSLKEQSKNGRPTFREEVKCANRLNGQTNDPMSEVAYDIYKETTAVINVKKEPNIHGSKSNSKDLKIHAAKNAELLQEQYSNLGLTDKDTTILTGTKNFLIKDIDGKTQEILGRKFNVETDKKSIIKGNYTYDLYDNGDGKGAIITTNHLSRVSRDNADNIHEIRKEQIKKETSKTKHTPDNKPITNTYTSKQQKPQTSFANSIINAGADICKSSMDYIKNNPKTVATVAAIAVVVVTVGFYMWKRYKKKHL